MNKKIFIIIAILVVLVILLFPKVIALNDGGTKIYKSLVYEVTKAHKIQTGGYLVEGTIVKLFGKQIYCDIPKEVKIIEDGKDKNEPSTTYEKNIDGVTLMLEIPKEWKYEELSRNTENDFYKYALKLYKTQEDKYAVLYFYHQMFGVCGTGRTSEQINLDNGTIATIGYYDGSNIWQDISFFETNKYTAIINYGLDKSESEEVVDFVKTISIIENNKNEDISLLVKEDTITSKGATFILKNNTDQDYAYEPSYYLEKKEDNKWNEIVLEEPLTWNSVIYTLKAREEKEINVDWSITGYGELKDGKYRLVKSNFRKSVSPDSSSCSVYAEFEVKEDNSSTKDEYEFIAEIIEAKEKSIIVKPDANSKEIKSSDKISIGITRPTNGTNDFYVVGNKVKITYNGIIMESYPAQIIATKIELAN